MAQGDHLFGTVFTSTPISSPSSQLTPPLSALLSPISSSPLSSPFISANSSPNPSPPESESGSETLTVRHFQLNPPIAQSPRMSVTDNDNKNVLNDLDSEFDDNDQCATDGHRFKVNTKRIWKDTADIIRLLERSTKKFKDLRAADLVVWLNDVGKLLRLINVPAKTGIPLMPFFLENPERERFNTLKDEKLTSWKTMSDAFVKLHECEADKEVALQEMATLVQGKLSIREFAEKIKRVGSYAYDDLKTVSRERLMASQFLNGVHRSIRTEIRRLPTVPKTLRDMTLQAEKISRLLKIEAEETFFTIPEYYRYTPYHF